MPPTGWQPPPDWTPDPAWPPAPPGWQFWTEDAPAQHPTPPAGGQSVRTSSRWARWGVAAAVVLLVAGIAGGVFAWLRYQNEQKLISSLTTIDVQDVEYTGIDAMTTASDGTLYVLTGAGDHLSPNDIAVLKVDPSTGATEKLPVPQDAFSDRPGPLAVGPDGSVFTGSHLWNPNTGAIQKVAAEYDGPVEAHATFDSRGELVYSVAVEDKNDGYRATTTVYRKPAQGESKVLATIPGYAWGVAVDPNSKVLLHVDATRWGDESAKILRISDDGTLETVQVHRIKLRYRRRQCGTACVRVR